jgi:hypothetical protein
MKNESRFFVISAPNHQDFNSQDREKIESEQGQRLEAQQRHSVKTVQKDHPVLSRHEGAQDQNDQLKRPAKGTTHPFFSCFCRLKNGQLDTLDLFS